MPNYDQLRIYQIEQPRSDRGIRVLELHRGFKVLHVSLSIGGMVQVSILEDTQAPRVLATFVLQDPGSLRPELQHMFGRFTCIGAAQRPDQTHVFLLDHVELAG